MSLSNKTLKFLDQNPNYARVIYGVMGLTGVWLAYIYGWSGFINNETKILRKSSEDIALSSQPITSLVSFANLFFFGIFGTMFIAAAFNPNWLKKFVLNQTRRRFGNYITIFLSIFLFLFICAGFILMFASIKYR